MYILELASIGFFVVLLGTLFLFGELLVKVKGIFGLLGTGIMTFYFSYHLSDGTGIWVLILYLAGLTLIILDGKVINEGTIGLLGLVLMILGLAIPTPNLVYGVLVAFGFLVGGVSSLLFLKVFPTRNIWSKITLKERLTGDRGYNSMNESYKSLTGKTGITKTPFRPTGTIDIEGDLYSATSEGRWIDSNVNVTVISVDGTRIVVKKQDE